MSWFDEEEKPPGPLYDVRLLWLAIGLVAVLAIGANFELWQQSRGLDAADDRIRSASRLLPHRARGAPSSASAADDPPAPITGCLQRWLQQGRPLLAAEDTMQQWRLHIEAMNRFVAGEITLEQASAFWNETRIGAIRRVERFQVDYARYREAAASCVRPDDQQLKSTPAAGRLERCADATRVSDRVLEVAEPAVETWEHHIHDMELLRSGEISPAQAARRWNSSWRAGNSQLDDYEDAAQRARSMRCP